MASVQEQLNESDLAGLDLHDGLFNYQLDTSRLRDDPNYRGFDNNSGSTWIYPTNYPVRKYQYDITHAALFRNTLVVLPTGLGKTFIAAVVMYNLYRWYPRGKIIFMAPTKPLVAQQIEACYQIMGIAKEDTAELTGKQAKVARESVWRAKRVFFVTPQVLAGDLADITFPVNDIKLIVVDEAHKARGKYAYNEVIRIIRQQNQHFRVLALTATPGRMEDVAQLVQSLHISHVEVRSEGSPDVAPYTHKKNIKSVVVRLGPELMNLRRDLLGIIDPYVSELQALNVISGSLESLHRGWLVVQQKQFVDAARQNRHPDHSHIMANFGTCISLYHSLELLERHGTQVFLNYFDDAERYFLKRDINLRRFLDRVRQTAGPNPFAATDDQGPVVNGVVSVPIGFDFGHPKYQILRDHVVRHFQENADTRSLVFCEFRESVFLIYHLLMQDSPLVKPKVFVGQNGAKSISQKQQIAIMSDFRQGLINVLIATSVAEEGMDVGETDLIVCFDIANKNPTRFVQRIGRTGRKRDGQVLMLATEGKEQQTLKEMLSNRDKSNHNIVNNKALANVMEASPRLIPTEFDPKCIETFIKIKGVVALAEENDPSSTKVTGKTKTKAKKSPSKTQTGMQDVRNFFKPIKTVPAAEAPTNASMVYNDTMDYPDEVEMSAISRIDEPSSTSLVHQEKSPEKIVELDIRVLQNIKKFRSLKRELLRTPTTAAKKLSTSDVVTNSLTPQSLRKYSLMNNLSFLRARQGQAAELLVKDSDISIESTFGGSEMLASFLESASCTKPRRQPLKTINLSQSMCTTRNLAPLCAVEKVFHTVATVKTPVVNDVPEVPSQTAYPFNTQLPQFIETESRYDSYVYSSATKLASSTPVALKVPTSTKKRRTNTKSPRRHSRSPLQTPIKKAFEQMRCKEQLFAQSFVIPDTSVALNTSMPSDECMEISRSPSPVIRSKASVVSNKLSETLKYFRLSSVLDIFVDEEESPPSLSNSKQNNNDTDLYIGDIDDIFVSDDSIDAFMGPKLEIQVPKPVISTGSSNDDDDFEESPRKPLNRLKQLQKNSTPISNKPPACIQKSIVTPKQGQNASRFNHDISDLFADSFSINDVSIAISSESDNEHHKPEPPKPIELETIPEESKEPPHIVPEPHSPDDCIQSSQATTPLVQRSLSSKLSRISANLRKSSGAKPTRQISDDMFDVTAASHHNNEPDEMSSSLKENSIQNSSMRNMSLCNTKSEESESSSKAKLALRSPPPKQQMPLKDVTTSPSVIRSRVSFSKLTSRVPSKKSSMPLSVKFEQCSNLARTSTAPNPTVRPDLSRFDRKTVPAFASQANTTLSPIAANYQRNRKAKAVTFSSSSSSDDDIVTKKSRAKEDRKRVTKTASSRKPKCDYFDDECEVSGDCSEDEDADATRHLAGLINDDEANETIGMDMRAVYMQSVRSPFQRPAQRPRRQMLDISNVFSQVVEPDDTSYGGCSFVVSDDDADDVPVAVSPELCPLERAELILKQRRAAKRLGIQLLSDEDAPDVVDAGRPKKKRRRIAKAFESSDED